MRSLIVLSRHHIFIAGFCIVFVASLIGLFIFEHSYEQRFYPNVVLGSELVGGKSFDEVLGRLRLVGESLATSGLGLVVPRTQASTTIMIPMRSTGLTPDVVVEYFSLGDYERAAREAFAVGRTGHWWSRWFNQMELIFRPAVFPLPVVVREPAIRSLLARELAVALIAPTDAHFIKHAGAITLVPDEAGETADVDAVVTGVSTILGQMRTNRLQILVHERPAAISKERLGVLVDFTNHLLEVPAFRFTYQSSTVYASGATVSTWLSLRPDPGVAIAVLRPALAEFLRQTVALDINDPPQNSRFAMSDGVLVETRSGRVGSIVDIEAAAQALEDQLTARYLALVFPGQHSEVSRPTPIEIVVQQASPRITAATVRNYAIRDLIGSAATSFKGSSASRRHNIATGVERVSGILIAPGEEFSLVKAIGEVSEETGFDKEYVIKGDRSVKEAGGGLCQVATTVFRAAMNAGLPITERQNHSYVVGYYGPGLDATIYGPWPDLRFVNDTGEYLLFQMKASGDTLSAEFYGKKDGRMVTVSEPLLHDYIDPPPDRYIPALDKAWGVVECTDHARKGLTANATYTVSYIDGRVKQQEFVSIYQPWPKICLVGIQIPPAPMFR